MAQIAAPRLNRQWNCTWRVGNSGRNPIRTALERNLKDWMRLPLDEITKAVVVRCHQDMAKTPSGANHVLRSLRSICNDARRTYDLVECPAMAIECLGKRPDARIIDDFKGWRKTIEDLPYPIHHDILAPPRSQGRQLVFPTVAMEDLVENLN